MPKNLLGYVTTVFENLVQKHNNFFENNQENKIHLIFGGDKGGKLMKFHFEIVSPNIPGTAHNVHVFAMYDGYDGAENMSKTLSPFWHIIKNMQEPDFTIAGHKVQVLFNGDFKHLSAIFGHQGASASFPSLKDEVTLSHLKNHPASPHTPHHCGPICPERKPEDLLMNYAENVLDDRGLGLSSEHKRRKHGKEHMSIVRHAAFPFLSLLQIIPPVLHITLGLVLKLFNILVLMARQADGLEERDITKHESDLEELTLEQGKLNRDHADMCERILGMANLCSRLEVESGDIEALDNLAENASSIN